MSGMGVDTSGASSTVAGRTLVPVQAVDPNDMTGKFNTQLSPSQEKAYGEWLRSQSKATGRDLSGDTYDYDLRGYWLENNGPDLGQGHLTDTYKKPNHPTFSDESKYSGRDGQQGGRWNDLGNGKYTFTPGATNRRYHSRDELRRYFKDREPDSVLVWE